jgi:hypothetical protein
LGRVTRSQDAPRAKRRLGRKIRRRGIPVVVLAAALSCRSPRSLDLDFSFLCRVLVFSVSLSCSLSLSVFLSLSLSLSLFLSLSFSFSVFSSATSLSGERVGRRGLLEVIQREKEREREREGGGNKRQMDEMER